MTTRKPRITESKISNYEFVFDSAKEAVLQCEYYYYFRDNLYGFNLSEISDLLERGKIPVIVIRKIGEINYLKTKYQNAVAILCKSKFDNERLAEYLQSKGDTEEECQNRLFSLDEKMLEKEYERDIGIFDFILENEYNLTFLQRAKEFLDKKK